MTPIQLRDNRATRHLPPWVRDIVFEAARAHGVRPFDIMSSARFRPIVRARHEAIYRTKAAKPHLSLPRLATWFNRDHSTVAHAIACHAERTGLPALVGYDLERKRAAA